MPATIHNCMNCGRDTIRKSGLCSLCQPEPDLAEIHADEPVEDEEEVTRDDEVSSEVEQAVGNALGM